MYFIIIIVHIFIIIFCILNFVFRIVDPEKQFQFDDGCLLSYCMIPYNTGSTVDEKDIKGIAIIRRTDVPGYDI